MILDRPAYGAPCNGCGQCCRDQLCPLASHVFHRGDIPPPGCAHAGPCPALEQDVGRAHCGLIRHPDQYAPIRAALHGKKALSDGAVILNGAGHGCDAGVDWSKADPAQRARMTAEVKAIPLSKIEAAKIAWGIA